MAEKLTPQQKMAVTDRGGKLLVSAAAGSGKTKVLVDRLISYITDAKDPANIDDFLIITYTKAAASELRGKIAAKLTERISEEPGNKHLQQQMQRLYLTKISTVHSFCSDILREYAFRLDLPADFRVAEENECQQMEYYVLDQLLEQAYGSIDKNPDLQAFINTQGLGRNDRQIPEIILKTFNSARCHLDPGQWLAHCCSVSQFDEIEDASETVWGKYLIDDLHETLDFHICALNRCCEQANSESGFEKNVALLYDTVAQLNQLRNCSQWDEIVAFPAIDYGRMVFSKEVKGTALSERMKAIRNACKTSIHKKMLVFADPSQQVLADLQMSGAASRGLVSLVQEFTIRYNKLKKAKRVLDFSDLEHKMLDLVLGKNRAYLTATAREIGSRYREIMVDEYQDSNAVQDAIFDALTKDRNNCFMVGDVKQSIYQFRLADPSIFIEKYESYVPAQNAQEGMSRRVILSHNFRSAGAVIGAVNDVFGSCMTSKVGGLDYGEEEMLREGVPHLPATEPEVELYAIQVNEDTYAEEAAFVADRITQLLDGTHMIRDGDSMRPIRREDIVILLRSPGSVGGEFYYALEQRGIRYATAGSADLLQLEEVQTLISLLQIINNPLQDIPMVAALSSRIFGFTADDLAAIRSKSRSSSFYRSLIKDESEKTRNFLNVLKQLRLRSRMCGPSELIEHIFTLTRMDSIYAAVDDGRDKVNNLHSFCQIAAGFEKTGGKDLGAFIEYLDMLYEKGLSVAVDGQNEDCVTIMSIHKSKGLEFPVVFLCGLSRDFNMENARSQVLCDKELGLGMCSVNAKQRVRYPTISKRAISLKTVHDNISEEMRVLYVAMTRAKDRLIMTYAAQGIEKDLLDIACRIDLSPRQLLTGTVNCPGEWILQAAMQRSEAVELHRISDKPDCTCVSDVSWHIRVVDGYIQDGCNATASCQEKESASFGIMDRIEKGLSFSYPYQLASIAPSKQTATQLKGRIKDSEISENTPERKFVHRQFRKPSFAEKQKSAVVYGNAMHTVMQYLDFSKCTDLDALTLDLERLCKHNYISRDEYAMVNMEHILNFFRTDIGKRLMASDRVLREFKFSILDDGSKYYPGMEGEQILLQGVVDCALIEEDGITVIDFKTDRITQDSLQQTTLGYRHQILAYASAMERIYQMPVKSKLLYYFHADLMVEI